MAFAMCADASRALRLFAGVVNWAEVDRERMCRAASGGFLTVTELADTLVREEGVSFRLAHRLVAVSVRNIGRDEAPEPLVAEMERLAPEILGRKLRKPRELWLCALDPAHFVAIRAIPGGPAPEAVRAQIADAEKEQAEAQEWVHAKRSLLDQYSQLMQKEILALKNASPLPSRG